jgi:hypothetical protein
MRLTACFGIGVVGSDENVERVAGDAALAEGAGERRVERLDDLRPRSFGRDLLCGRPGLERKLLEQLGVDRVRDVHDDLGVELPRNAARDTADAGPPCSARPEPAA